MGPQGVAQGAWTKGAWAKGRCRLPGFLPGEGPGLPVPGDRHRQPPARRRWHRLAAGGPLTGAGGSDGAVQAATHAGTGDGTGGGGSGVGSRCLGRWGGWSGLPAGPGDSWWRLGPGQRMAQGLVKAPTPRLGPAALPLQIRALAAGNRQPSPGGLGGAPAAGRAAAMASVRRRCWRPANSCWAPGPRPGSCFCRP
jgi:hypothetical protein